MDGCEGLDAPPAYVQGSGVPRPKRRTQGAAGALRGKGSQTVDASTVTEVARGTKPPRVRKGTIAGNLAHPRRPAESLPQPWLIGSAEILAELTRIRGLAIAIPLTLESNGPTNSVIDALWRFEEELRYVLRLQAQAQSAFAERHVEPPATTITFLGETG